MVEFKVVALVDEKEVETIVPAETLQQAVEGIEDVISAEVVIDDPKLGLDDWFEDVQEGLEGITTAAEKIAAKVTELSEEQTDLLTKVDPEFLPKLSGAVDGLGEGLEEFDMRMTDIAVELDEME